MLLRQIEVNCKAAEEFYTTMKENLASVMDSSVYEDEEKVRLSTVRDEQLAKVEGLQQSLNDMRQKLRCIISVNDSFTTNKLTDQIGTSSGDKEEK
ncbi:hypothetical protein KIN20_003003 [Parelaphostrongylus tenuis]|uniref:Uncharacterized protein n=1 Tax=Parelaphostrongylus tenuis TaxID=148309 RepID=A0AAD5MHM9_PARTN|nr:hypothetical protein KIN20_003003 [Parelaphostrongylus tenuis]